MFNNISEKKMHLVRWFLAIAWLVLIASLFYDPISSSLTITGNTWSPFQINPELFDPQKCQEILTIQGKCVPEEVISYPLGAKIFWVMILPIVISMLLFLGHEAWRRVCPLAFMAQISRAISKQRQNKKVNPKTQKIRYELAKVPKKSWLAKNHLYLQFGFLAIGLSLRTLFINSDRIILGGFLIFTILSAIFVGYFYAGKSWCQYVCPMAPVEMILTGPRALWGSQAHQGDRKKISQSTCRTFDQSGKEKNACVGCQSPCIDIDAERNYWELFKKPGRRFIHYGYIGLVLGFYLYYWFYSGTLQYYYSGVTNHENNQLQTLLDPGFYIFGEIIPIPKLIAVPLTIIIFIILSNFILRNIEKIYYSYRQKHGTTLTKQEAQHQVFTVCTFTAFNVYFLFGGRLFFELFPAPIELICRGLVVGVSTLWMYRTIFRTSQMYSKESLVNSLRRQLSKLNINFPKFLEGRSMDDLKADEVYVLAKVLPNFSKESSLQVYKGVLRDALEQGNVKSANSFEKLEQLRLELEIKDEEHYNILTELSVESPELFDPKKIRTRETQLRLESYREALEVQLLDLLEMGIPLADAIARRTKQVEKLKQEYGITLKEEEELFASLGDTKSTVLKQADTLLDLLKDLNQRDRALQENISPDHTIEFNLLRSLGINNKQQIIFQKLLSILEVLGESEEAKNIALSIIKLINLEIRSSIIDDHLLEFPWSERLDHEILKILQTPQTQNNEELLLSSIDVLEELLQELEPLITATALHTLNKLDPQKGRQIAENFLNNGESVDHLIIETSQRVLGMEGEKIPQIPTLTAQIKIKGENYCEVFQQSIIRVGRSLNNDLVLNDVKIAKQHAILYFDEDSAKIETTGSAYGVRIDGRFIKNTRQELKPQDTIYFSRGEEPSIVVSWDKQSAQSCSIDDTLGIIDKLLLLLEIPLFQAVKPEVSLELAKKANIHIYPKGIYLCKQGESSNELFLLIEGSANVNVFQDNTKVVINTISPGTTIGEMGILTRQVRSANVVTTNENNRVLVVKAEDFERVLEKDSQVSKQLLLEAIARLQRLTKKVENII